MSIHKSQEVFLKRVAEFLPADAVLTSAEDRARFGSDWTKVPSHAGPVVLPRSTEDVSRVLKLCSELGLPVVPSGGRTGLAGGAVATQEEIVLSTSRLQRLDAVDGVGRTVRAQAGVTTQAVHEHAARLGLIWPIDLASKGSATIGGNLSTNAGGVRVIRYGMSRKWVIGLQAVTMAGEILELNQDLEKNNTGFDLLQLIIGSEGCLAVITEATLKLTRQPEQVAVFLFGVPSLTSAVELFENARRGPFDILAFEFFSEKCSRAVREKLGKAPRFTAPYPFYVLMEIETSAGDAARELTEEWLASALEQGLVSDGMMARSSEERREVWALREGITESLQMTAPLKKYDVSVPVRSLEPFLQAAQDTLKRDKYGLDLYLFGHLGDGSPHLNLLKPADSTLEKFESEAKRFEQALFPLLRAHRGSVSAEHGVGLLKKHWVQYSRTAEELRLFKALKQSFDPLGLLNPGKVVDLETR